MDEASDQMLLAAARRGDGDALETLLTRYQPRVYRFGIKMCGDPEDAKDVLQETLLAMARSVRDFRGASSLTTWLYTIARSFCVKKRRRGRFAPRREESLEAQPSQGTQVRDARPGPEENAVRRQLEVALARAIASLDPIYREVLVLRDVEGLTAPEVAEVLGIAVDAVKSRLHRARLAVREALLPQFGIDDDKTKDLESRGCPDVLTLFSRHLEGEIGADLCTEMERHLDRCERCRGACDSLRRTLALCQSSPTPQVPEAIQQAVRESVRRYIARRR